MRWPEERMCCETGRVLVVGGIIDLDALLEHEKRNSMCLGRIRSQRGAA